MNVILLLRVLGVLFFYDAVICAIKIQGVNLFFLSAITVLSALSVLLADRFNKNRLLQLSFGMITFLPALLVLNNKSHIFIMLLPVIYCFSTIVTRRFELHYYYIQMLLKIMLVLNIAVTLYAFKYDADNYKIYIFCYLSVVTLIFAARGARMGEDNSIRNAGIEFVTVFMTCLLSFVGVGIIWFLVKIRFFHKLLSLIGTVLGAIVLMFDFLYVDATKDFGNEPVLIPPKKEDMVFPDEGLIDLASSFEYENPASRTLGSIIIIVLLILGFISILGFLWPFIKAVIKDAINIWFGSKNEKEKSDIAVTNVRSTLEIKKVKKAKGNTAKIRKIYKDYLKYLSTIGQTRQLTDTSKEVLERSMEKRKMYALNNELYEEAVSNEQKLRELYLKARYDAEYKATNEEVKAARALLKALMN